MNDFIVNGQAHGPMATVLIRNNYDLGIFRPFLNDDHRDPNSYATLMGPDGKPAIRRLANDVATMRFEEWRTWDNMMIEAAKERLGFVSWIMSKGYTHSVNAMNTMVLSHNRVSDVTGASISMDGLAKTYKDQPVFDIVNLPLPLIHQDFGFPWRGLSVAKANGTPVDTITARLVAHQIAEKVEDLALGNISTYAYQGLGTVYGLRTYPSRATKVLTLPTAPGWSPSLLVDEVLDMQNTSRINLNYGPWNLFTSVGWEPFLKTDYSAAYPGLTVADRVQKAMGSGSIVPLDKLSGYQAILVQDRSTTLRMVIGMPLKLIQWNSPDGQEVNFRYLTCMVPQFFSDIAGNCGIVHGTAA